MNYILVLGGSSRLLEREKIAKDFMVATAVITPDTCIWVSSGGNPLSLREVFSLPDSRVRIDYEAVDTVTNFTTFINSLSCESSISKVYIITSDFHMRRAFLIARIIFFKAKFEYYPVTVPSAHPPESAHKIIRDVVRAFLWLVTGHTGYRLGAFLNKKRSHFWGEVRSL